MAFNVGLSDVGPGIDDISSRGTVGGGRAERGRGNMRTRQFGGGPATAPLEAGGTSMADVSIGSNSSSRAGNEPLQGLKFHSHGGESKNLC